MICLLINVSALSLLESQLLFKDKNAFNIPHWRLFVASFRSRILASLKYTAVGVFELKYLLCKTAPTLGLSVMSSHNV